MVSRERIRRLAWACASMTMGTVMVLGTILLVNHFSDSLEQSRAEADNAIALERKKPPAEQKSQKPRPQPKPRRNPRIAPAPLSGLDTTLSGIDMGLPGFSADDLGALEGDLLGTAEGIVMTDETVDQPPQASYQAAPVFPPRARSRGIEGYVIFSLLIGVTGDIEQIKVIESSPEGVFEEAATQGISQWRFEPALYQGQAVRSWAKQRIRFDLD